MIPERGGKRGVDVRGEGYQARVRESRGSEVGRKKAEDVLRSKSSEVDQARFGEGCGERESLEEGAQGGLYPEAQ